MKKTALTLMALALFGFFLAAHDHDYAIQEKEEISKTFKVADASQAAEVIINNVWGSVRVVFKRAPVGKCSFGNVNGDLTISFPADLSADFRIKTFNSEVYSDFPVTYFPPAPAVREETKGKYVFKRDRFFGVRAGKGGPEIKMDTLNGDILIKKRTV